MENSGDTRRIKHTEVSYATANGMNRINHSKQPQMADVNIPIRPQLEFSKDDDDDEVMRQQQHHDGHGADSAGSVSLHSCSDTSDKIDEPLLTRDDTDTTEDDSYDDNAHDDALVQFDAASCSTSLPAASTDRHDYWNIVRKQVLQKQQRASERYSFVPSKIQSDLVPRLRRIQWASQFRRCDPRFHILKFFSEVAQEGVENMSSMRQLQTKKKELQVFDKASVFTVWRPTSIEAIRKMMLGQGVGKGLDIKGKSSKRGKLSGYVPFLQIHQEDDKHKCRTLARDGPRMRIFYSTEQARDLAAKRLGEVSIEMITAVTNARTVLDKHNGASSSTDDDNHEEMDRAMNRIHLWDMDQPQVTFIMGDDAPTNCFGLEVAERLFWEAYVMSQDITRHDEFDTGRPSQPAFQEMNFEALRKTSANSRPVVYHFDDSSSGDTPATTNPMCPLHLLMAYEEHGRVCPVVSDFDCFLVGTRRVAYRDPLPSEQVELLKWSVSQIETILDDDNNDSSTKNDNGAAVTASSWTNRWLEVLKESAIQGFQLEMPQFGFGDPRSYSIMEHAVSCLTKDGAVRHGAECFNYYFPQELDEHFLVISNTLPGNVQWKYINVTELQNLLCDRIKEGFTFPLNPKWILCDIGWKDVYDKLMASQKRHVQDSLDVWYPRESGIREQMEAIHARHPNGFQTKRKTSSHVHDGTGAMDLAKHELKHYLTLRRAKLKLRAALLWMQLNRSKQEEEEAIQNISQHQQDHEAALQRARLKLRAAVLLIRLGQELEKTKRAKN